MQEIKTNDKGVPSNTKGSVLMNGGVTSSFTIVQNMFMNEVRKRIDKAVNDYKPGTKYRACYEDEDCEINVESDGTIHVWKINDDFITEFDFKVTSDNTFIDCKNNITDTRHRIVSTEQLQAEETERSNVQSSYGDVAENSKNLDGITVIGKTSTTISDAKNTASQINVNAQETAASLIKLTGLGVLSVDTLKLLKEAGPDMIKDMAQDLVMEGTKTLAERSSKLAGAYAQKVTQLSLTIPTEILKYTKLRFNWTKADAEAEEKPDAVLKKTIGDIIKELALPTEKVVKEKQEKDKESKTKKFINDVLQKAPQMINDVNNFVNDASKEMESIMGYVAEGPAYIEQQMNNFVDDKLEWADEHLEKVYKSVQKEVLKFCKNVGNWQGTQLVIAYNAAIYVAACALRYVQSKMTAKAQAKAKQAIQVAKLQIMSKLDIELPI